MSRVFDKKRAEIKSDKRVELVPITIWSSIYTNTKIIWDAFRKINKNESDLDSWKSRENNLLLSFEN